MRSHMPQIRRSLIVDIVEVTWMTAAIPAACCLSVLGMAYLEDYNDKGLIFMFVAVGLIGLLLIRLFRLAKAKP